MMDDQEKMMGEEDKMMQEKEVKLRILEDDDEVEVACCGKFTYFCSAVFIGIVLILEFFILLIELYFIATNDYFDISYGAFYAFFLIPILVTVIAFFVWLCNRDNKDYRKYLGNALLVAVIGNFILVAWVIIYICAIYDNNNEEVIVQQKLGTSEKQDEVDGEHGNKNQDMK